MSDFSLPRVLIVIQTIFGEPLKSSESFRAGDINRITEPDIGRSNYNKPLQNLVKAGWLEAREEKAEKGIGIKGRPSLYVYARTAKGRREYDQLKRMLARYGITLK